MLLSASFWSLKFRQCLFVTARESRRVAHTVGGEEGTGESITFKHCNCSAD